MRLLTLLAALALAACATVPATPEPAWLVTGNKAENSVSFIDLATGAEAARLPTGAMPHEIAVSPDGRTVAVVHYGAKAVELFDVASQRSLRTIDLGENVGPHGIQWTRDDRLVVTTERSGTLTIVDLANDDAVTAIPTGAEVSHMVVLSPDERTAYVSSMGSGSVSVIDLAAARKTADIPAGQTPEGLALSPDGRTLWVADRDNATLIAFETGSNREIARYTVGSFPIRVAVSPDGKRVVTSNYADGSLSVLGTDGTIRTVPVSGGTEAAQVTILFAPDSRHLYVAETGKARVALVDLDTGEVVRRYAAGEGADGLALAGR